MKVKITPNGTQPRKAEDRGFQPYWSLQDQATQAYIKKGWFGRYWLTTKEKATKWSDSSKMVEWATKKGMVVII